MNQTKELLRAVLKKKRLNLDANLRSKSSAQIVSSLKSQLELGSAKHIHIYEALTSLGEVDVGPFIEYVRSNFPDSLLYTSKRLNGEWAIVTLEENKQTDVSFDYIIVPMLGFDESLERIGYGGGYYDKFLKTQNKAKKIGVCFEIGRVKNLPKEKHDVSLDSIVTEKQIYYKK